MSSDNIPTEAKRISDWRRDMQRARFGHRLRLAIGILAVGSILVMAFASPIIAPFDPVAQNLPRRFLPPMTEFDGRLHLLGTDVLGRDIFSRVVYGARISVIVGVGAVVVQGLLGVCLGLLAGYYRRLDNVIMRAVDVQLALPFFVLALAVMAIIGPGLVNIIFVLGITGWASYARVVRAEVLSMAGREFIQASRVIGVSDTIIIVRHILPNIASSIIVIATFEVPRMIISEAALSFLGLGVQPPTPTWGGMVADARDYLNVMWWAATFPGLAIVAAVLGVNLLGDWMRDRGDPTTRAMR